MLPVDIPAACTLASFTYIVKLLTSLHFIHSSMALRVVSRVLAIGLVVQPVECHVEDALALVQSVVHVSPAAEAATAPTWSSAAELQGLREVRLKDGDVQISFWRKLKNITSAGSIARLEGSASAENLLRALSWEFNASETGEPKTQPELALTMQYRARLGNRLFQWAALVSIAAEAGAKVAAPFNPKYNPESTPQLSKVGPLIWQDKEFQWLGSQPKKCHIWDRIPVKLDWNMENLSNFTLGGVPKGELQLQADGPKPERTQNWARTWADAITRTLIHLGGAACSMPAPGAYPWGLSLGLP
ncbi:unnamed protein product [Prorocentrum cordatum]|uniref:Amine oxidase n=1 Tax=Prorocentrum cordatum TaxID=2364126 RepID=A0ABN9TVS1_9DINO|nr:unnamed protein product [Polarella glacialis]